MTSFSGSTRTTSWRPGRLRPHESFLRISPAPRSFAVMPSSSTPTITRFVAWGLECALNNSVVPGTERPACTSQASSFVGKVYDTIGPFDISLHCAMDYDFFLRASSHFEFHHLPVDFGFFREYAGSKTGEGAAEAFEEVRACLVRFVRQAGNGSPSWTATRGFFAQAGVWVNDAVAHYRRGRAKRGAASPDAGSFSQPLESRGISTSSLPFAAGAR